METNALGDSQSYAFDASGFVTSAINRNGKITTYTIDGNRRLTLEKWYQPVDEWNEVIPEKTETTRNKS